MINRKLTTREEEILDMIRPTTFQDIVEVVRRDIEYSKYNAKRELRNLHNGISNGTVNVVDNKHHDSGYELRSSRYVEICSG